jgi:glycosyltransferase involved in cell wall biosynthesis
VPLKIVGGGPLAADVAVQSQRLPGVEMLGPRSPEDVRELMRDAFALVMPSLWYEGFPMVIAEAFSTGLPVIASDLGSLASILDHGRTGMLFQAGDSADLAAKVEWACRHPEAADALGRGGRREYETKYTADAHHRQILEIYRRAIGRSRDVASRD